jgi:hypothetical protein
MRIKSQTKTFLYAIVPPAVALAAGATSARVFRDYETAGYIIALAGVWVLLAMFFMREISESADRSRITKVNLNREFDEEEEPETEDA